MRAEDAHDTWFAAAVILNQAMSKRFFEEKWENLSLLA
jgi:hypothetical protein